MGKKEKYVLPLPGDVGNEFLEQDDILNYRPTIAFVAPEHDLELSDVATFKDDEPTPEDIRNRLRAAQNNLRAIQELANIAEARIDGRVDTLGGLAMRLDPLRDAVTISAMKRTFPDKEDPSVITYDDYKACLKNLEADARSKTDAAETEMVDALSVGRNNPLKTDFGGLGSLPGSLRPEVSKEAGGSGGSGVSPLDIVAFQATVIIGIFTMMTGLITDLVKSLLP